MSKNNFVIGLDYGSDSVRCLIVDASNGKEIASAVHHYSRWQDGKFCQPVENQFRQHPLDYLEGLEITVRKSLKAAGANVAENIKGISIDTTGSTPIAVDKDGTALALHDEFKNNPHAMFILWKDHTGIKEAEEINNLAHSGKFEDFTKYSGGIYSSEWFWAKVLHTLRADKKVRNAAFSWVEHCDWLPAVLTGDTNPLTLKRGRCSAGHKAMWHESFGGLPSEEFLTGLDPLLKGVRGRLYRDTYTSDSAAGLLSAGWAKKLGLSGNIVVGVGAFDAHMGAVGGQIKPNILSKVMGTSTCDMLIAPMDKVGKKLIRGICGQVDGSIVPGMLGMEAGQSAFGDIYAWYRNVLMWPLQNALASEVKSESARKKIIDAVHHAVIPELSKSASKLPIGESGIVALDWMNGRRTPDANQALKGAVAGLNLGSDAPRIFRSLVEATAFGSKKIVDRFQDQGVDIKGVIALGGVAKKSPFIMQTVTDVLGMKIKVARSEQACALGAAMFASVVAGIHKSVEKAQDAMGSGFEAEYTPDKVNSAKYAKLYDQYSSLGGFVEKETKK
ncbi:MAG TPA: ribulokinase [Lentisphaeria bacterium]|nr:MAG: ribulokinase [Lentisphaerae bacterium GWF2_50_93]HCE43404.1 ribulokinase [Lentisphaeria bacterium]